MDRLEITLIELEYAAADFGHWKRSITEPSDLWGLLPKLMEANRAVQIALDALKARSERRVASRRSPKRALLDGGESTTDQSQSSSSPQL
jgi:hypothetical protein